MDDIDLLDRIFGRPTFHAHKISAYALKAALSWKYGLRDGAQVADSKVIMRELALRRMSAWAVHDRSTSPFTRQQVRTRTSNRAPQMAHHSYRAWRPGF